MCALDANGKLLHKLQVAEHKDELIDRLDRYEDCVYDSLDSFKGWIESL